jgi:hypothetical protein
MGGVIPSLKACIQSWIPRPGASRNAHVSGLQYSLDVDVRQLPGSTRRDIQDLNVWILMVPLV